MIPLQHQLISKLMQMSSALSSKRLNSNGNAPGIGMPRVSVYHEKSVQTSPFPHTDRPLPFARSNVYLFFDEKKDEGICCNARTFTPIFSHPFKQCKKSGTIAGIRGLNTDSTNQRVQSVSCYRLHPFEMNHKDLELGKNCKLPPFDLDHKEFAYDKKLCAPELKEILEFDVPKFGRVEKLSFQNFDQHVNDRENIQNVLPTGLILLTAVTATSLLIILVNRDANGTTQLADGIRAADSGNAPLDDFSHDDEKLLKYIMDYFKKHSTKENNWKEVIILGPPCKETALVKVNDKRQNVEQDLVGDMLTKTKSTQFTPINQILDETCENLPGPEEELPAYLSIGYI